MLLRAYLFGFRLTFGANVMLLGFRIGIVEFDTTEVIWFVCIIDSPTPPKLERGLPLVTVVVLFILLNYYGGEPSFG